jgi:hypothetical protein
MMLCKHEWELINQVITQSKFEHAMNQMKEFDKGSAKLPWQLCSAERKVIQIFTCKKCGKLKKFVDKI